MNQQIKDKWDKHYAENVSGVKQPATVLLQNQHLLPTQGTALDLACGRGTNAICLAEHGLTVTAWDISSTAINALATQSQGLAINYECRDILESPPQPNSFDVILVSLFLERQLIPHIKNAIKKNGLIFYQTFTKEKVHAVGPSNPDYLLNPNELLHFFQDWHIVFYQEEGAIGNLKKGYRDHAMLIAKNIITHKNGA